MLQLFFHLKIWRPTPLWWLFYNSLTHIKTLGLDGSCAIAPGCELWQRASWAVAAHLGPTVNGLVHLRANSFCGRERCTSSSLLGFPWSEQSGALADWQPSSCAMFHRGMRLGQWGGDLFPYWHYIRMLLVDGSSCAWIPSHDKVPRWRSPEGWLDVLRAACLMPKRMLARLI